MVSYAMDTHTTNPLDDVTVIELTQMVAGSFAGMHLSDMGADVVKVEPPDGEIARNVDPKVGGESFYYMSVNRGKQSVALDLKSEAGREAFLALADDADVVLENYRPGTVDDLGVGYDDVRARNPDVIYASVSAFGQTGPKREKAGVDPVLQAYGGVASMTRDEDGRPLRVGLTIADLAGSMYAVQAVLGALRRRDRVDDGGDYLDVALSDSLLSFLSVRAGYSFATGEEFPSIARSHVYFVPEGIFPTEDGYVQVSTVNEKHWERLCEAIDREDLCADPDYKTITDRRENRDDLNDVLDAVFQRRTTDEWVETLNEYGVPGERVNTTVSVWENEHTRAREMQTPVERPDGESFPTVSYPVKHDDWERTPETYIASTGEDTEAVLRDAGLDDEQLDAVLESNLTD